MDHSESSGHPHTLRGVIILLISAVLFGSYGVWSKLIGDDFGNFFQAWTRGVFVLLFLLPLLYFRNAFRRVKREDFKWFAIYILSGAMVAAPFFYAMNTIGIAATSLLFYSTSLLVMYIVGTLVFGEQLTKIKIISFCTMVTGLVLVFYLSLGKLSLLAMLLAIFGGACAATAVAFSKKISKRYPAFLLTAMIWAGMILVNLPISLIIGEPQVAPSLSAPWIYQALYALVVIGALSTTVIGLRYVEATLGGLMRTLQIVFGIVFGVLIFSEALTLQIVIGCILIMTAAALPYLVSARTDHGT